MKEHDELPNEIAELITAGTPAEKAFREHHDISVDDLAIISGVPSYRIDEIEAGSTPTDAELKAIGGALEVPAELLIEG